MINVEKNTRLFSRLCCQKIFKALSPISPFSTQKRVKLARIRHHFALCLKNLCGSGAVLGASANAKSYFGSYREFFYHFKFAKRCKYIITPIWLFPATWRRYLNNWFDDLTMINMVCQRNSWKTTTVHGVTMGHKFSSRPFHMGIKYVFKCSHTQNPYWMSKVLKARNFYFCCFSHAYSIC